MNKKKRFLYDNFKSRKGQIWVETVIYTLIAFTLIGLVLAFAKPKIEEIQDKGAIEQSIDVLEEIDQIIKNLGGPGNQRVITLKIGNGALNIDGDNNQIFFELEGRYEYSEPGKNINIGDIEVLTEKKARTYDITLTMDYEDDYDITYNDANELKKLSSASTPYKILIADKGEAEDKRIINIEIL
jgi:hypothetical protein